MEIEDLRLRLAELGKNNLYFLCKGILGMDRLVKPLHREICTLLESPNYSKKLILIPRGFYKTSIAAIGRAIQKLAKDPNQRILICCNTMRNAQRRLKKIEKVFESNQLFRWIYPNLIPDFDKVPWNANEMVIRREEDFVEPSIDVAGVGTAVTSRHFTTIIKDDIVDDKNTNTPELIEDVIEWDAEMLATFVDPEDPTNEEIVIGTPWSNTDIYSVKREDPDFAVYIRHALENSERKPDFFKGESIFPERYTREKIVKIRQRLANDNLFFCQFMCDPYGGFNATFRREWFQYFEIPPGELEVSITCDPGGYEKRSDFTGITVVGVDYRNDWYILETIKLRLNPREIIETLFDLYRRYPQTHTIGVEPIAYQKSLIFFATEEMRRRSIFLPIKPLTVDSSISKQMRIKGLIPRFSNMTIWLKRSMKDLEDELFEKVPNDDLIDSLAYQLQIATIRPQLINKVLDDPFSIDSILLELYKKNSPMGSLLKANLINEYVETRIIPNHLAGEA